MRNRIIDNLIFFSYSLLLHIICIVFFIIGIEEVSVPRMVKIDTDIVKATMIDESSILLKIARRQVKEEKSLKVSEYEKEEALEQLKEGQKEIMSSEQEFLYFDMQSKMERHHNAISKQEQKRIEKINSFGGVLEQKLAEDKRVAQEKELLAEIKQHVKLYWTRPANTKNGLQVTLRVRLLPSGDVEKVMIIESSNNIIFDRSAELAVYKASPLPMPLNARVVSKFLNFNFIFNP